MDFTIQCVCAGHAAQDLIAVTGANLEKWRTMYQHYQKLTCPQCGCQYNLADETTQIGKADVSPPRIDSISPSTGTMGTAVTITGHRLDLGTLTVKFGGIAGTNVRSRTNTSAIVDAPAGSGAVDVEVENGNGQRATGGKLVGAFTYS